MRRFVLGLMVTVASLALLLRIINVDLILVVL